MSEKDGVTPKAANPDTASRPSADKPLSEGLPYVEIEIVSADEFGEHRPEYGFAAFQSKRRFSGGGTIKG